MTAATAPSASVHVVGGFDAHAVARLLDAVAQHAPTVCGLLEYERFCRDAGLPADLDTHVALVTADVLSFRGNSGFTVTAVGERLRAFYAEQMPQTIMVVDQHETDEQSFATIDVKGGPVINFADETRAPIVTVDVRRDLSSGHVLAVLVQPAGEPIFERVLLFGVDLVEGALPLADMPAPVTQIIGSALGLTAAEITGMPVR